MFTEADLIVAPDKGTHFIAGAGVFLAVIGVTHAPWWALFGCALAAATKEAWDAARNRQQRAEGVPATHDPSWADFGYTCAGGAVCFLSVCAS